MRRAGFVCQSCLSRARQCRRPPFLTRPPARASTYAPTTSVETLPETNDEHVPSPLAFEPLKSSGSQKKRPADREIPSGSRGRRAGQSDPPDQKNLPEQQNEDRTKILPWLYASPPTRDTGRKIIRYKHQRNGEPLIWWETCFSRISNRLENGVSDPGTGKYHEYAPDHSDLPQLLAAEDVDAMRRTWQGLKREAGTLERFTHTMLDALHRAPDRAPSVLWATFEKDVGIHVVHDCIMLFLNRYKVMVAEEQAATTTESTKQYAEDVVNMVIHILENSGWESAPLTQHGLYTLSRMATPSALAAIYSALKLYPPRMAPFTKLQIAGRLAKEPQFKVLAMEILRDLIQVDGVQRDSSHVAALVTSIICFSKKAATNPEYNETRARLFEEILSLGIEFNLVTYTALIRNFCLSREMKVAWQVLEVMRGRGIEPDDRLMSVLIHGCKLTGDWASIDRLARELAKGGLGIENPIIYNDLIHCMYAAFLEGHRSHVGERVMPAFPTMLQAYAKFFDMKPLQRLLPMHNLEEMVKEAGDPKMAQLTQGRWIFKVVPILEAMDQIKPGRPLEPRRDTILIMLLGYLQSLSNVYHTVAFYTNFRRLLEGGDRLVTQVVNNRTFIHDQILLGLVKWPGMLRVALDIINEMIRDAKESSKQVSEVETRPGCHPAPSAYTWSILLKGLSAAKQLDYSERLLNIMGTYGFKPCSVDWNMLIGSYARNQDVEGTVRAVERREAAGFKPNEYTSRAFSHLRDSARAGALRLMESKAMQREEMNHLLADTERLADQMGRQGYDCGHGEELRDRLRRFPSLKGVEKAVHDKISREVLEPGANAAIHIGGVSPGMQRRARFLLDRSNPDA